MTSREELGRAKGVLTFAFVLAGVCAAAGAAGAAADHLVQEASGAIVNWRRGLVSATAGAAPDHRMPSAEIARPGAERRASATARKHIAEALRKLPLGGGRHLDEQAVGRALERARVAEVEYQSNGGAVVTLEVLFGAWDSASPSASAESPPSAAPVALLLPEARLVAAPVVLVGTREVIPGPVRYSNGAPPSGAARPLKAKADKTGRLVIDASAPDLAGQPLLIYVQKVLR